METKVCNTCREEKPLEAFRIRAVGTRTSVENKCRKCGSRRNTEWSRENRDKIVAHNRARYASDEKLRERRREIAREWRKKNKDKVASHNRRWRSENRERGNAMAKEWRDRNPDHAKMCAKERRARVRGARTEPVRRVDINDLLKKQKNRCALCRCVLKDFHIDHIQPLSRGGEHAKRNLQITCAPCNLSKNAKPQEDFMRERGFLL